MWLALAFVALGFLIGNLVGLSATPIVASLIALLFAFGGGSILAFLQKLSGADRRVAAQALFAFSLSCLAGIYLGLVVSEHRLLSPKGRRPTSQATGSPFTKDGAPSANGGDKRSDAGGKAAEVTYASNGYLRSALANKANAIRARYRNNEPNFGAAAAFDSLYTFIMNLGDSTNQQANRIAARYERGELTDAEAFDELHAVVVELVGP